MSNDRVFAGAIPALYERLLVPLIFASYAEDLARRVAEAQPARVLEIAAGTGVVTRALATRLPASTRIVATDLNPAMLEEAARQPIARPVEWQPADALDLPFPNASFDVVACQFGAMFFPDRVRGYAQARRMLAPGGRFVFNTWDAIEDNEFADEVTRVLSDHYPQSPPRFLARTPHGYHDRERVRADLEAAGFVDPVIETLPARSRAGSAREVAVAYCQGTPLRGELEALGGDAVAVGTELASAALLRRFGEGPIDGKIQALVVTAAR